LRPGSEPGDYEYHYMGKGAKARWRDLPGPVYKALDHYLILSGRKTCMLPSSPLFVASGNRGKNLGQPLAEQSIRRLLDQAAKRAGLPHLKVHGLRHTAAKLKRKSGDSLEQVSDFLDHAGYDVTRVYLNSVESKKDTSWQKVADLIGEF
jgi:integrase